MPLQCRMLSVLLCYCSALTASKLSHCVEDCLGGLETIEGQAQVVFDSWTVGMYL